MEKYISVLGVVIAIMLTLFFVVAKFVGAGSISPSSASCEQIEDMARRNICLKDIAFKSLDISPCLEIENVPERDICMRNVAMKTKDGTICLQISTPGIKSMCIRGLS